MKDEIKLKFLEIVYCREENLCTCVLTDVASTNRKIFLTLTVEEASIVRNIIDKKYSKTKTQYAQKFIANNVKSFIKSDYKIESAKVEVSIEGVIGSLILKKKHEKFNLLTGVFTVILLMLSENISVFTHNDSFDFCSVSTNLYNGIKHDTNNSEKDLLEKLDFFIEEENCRKLKEICEKIKDSKIDIRLLVNSV